jgi:PAS domain-containing protein
MAAGKKKPAKKNTDTPGIERTLRDYAEKQLALTTESSPSLKGQNPEQLVHELGVHQIQLEMQAEQLRVAQLVIEESRDKYFDLYKFAPIGYLTLTDKALITEVNLTGAKLLGVERSKLVNHGLGRFIALSSSGNG